MNIKPRMLRRVLTLILILIIATTACLTGCGSFNEEKPDSQAKDLERFTDVYFDAFDTVINVIAYCDSEESFKTLSERIHKELLRYHYIFDIYNLYDGINNARRVNKKAGEEPVEVDPELIRLIEEGKRIYDETEGRVNIAMGSVLSLWHQARVDSLDNPEKAYIPNMDELKKASEHCNIEDIIVDEGKSTIFLKDPKMSLDLGAIAKGFAIEEIVLKLEEEGYSNFIISAGGNVRASGLRADGTEWVVAVQNPKTDSDESYIDLVNITDESLVTSGVYRRYFEYQGKSYHHIIDTETLMPENRYLSVSIITVNSGFADALSTAVFNMDLEEGQAFVEATDGVEALWVLPDETIVKSSGWKSKE